MNNKLKKILITFLILLGLLGALCLSNSQAAIVTDEMDATGIGGESTGGVLKDVKQGDTVPNLYMQDMYNSYDIFCADRGNLAADKTKSKYKNVFYKVQEDKAGNLPKTLKDKNSTRYQKDKIIASPKEAFILAEMLKNEYKVHGMSVARIDLSSIDYTKPVKIDLEDANIIMAFDGVIPRTVYVVEYATDSYKYYIEGAISGKFYEVKLKNLLEDVDYNNTQSSYVQVAWWKTAGGGNAPGLAENALSLKATAFESYIKKITGNNDVDKMEYTPHSYKILRVNDDGTTTEREGTVNAPKLKYEPTWESDTTKVVTTWDAPTNTYRVGPFKISYIDETYTDKDSGVKTIFSGIVGSKLETNLGEFSLITDKNATLEGKQYRFIYINGELPAPHEEFYIEVPYQEGLTKITNLQFDFKYMNAGGEYQFLEGYATDTKTGKVVSVQDFAYGIKAARWYEDASLNTGLDVEERKNEGTLTIQKNVTDPVDVDTDFEFTIDIIRKDETGAEKTETRKEIVTVKAGEKTASRVVATENWKGEDAPRYKVTEVTKEGYVQENIQNAEGTFAQNETVTCIVDNKIDQKVGKLKIIKIAEGENLQDRKYYFKITVEGNDPTIVEISQATNWEYVSGDYTWTNEEAPSYTVEEVKEDGSALNPDEIDFEVQYSNTPGTLVANETVEVTATNIEKAPKVKEGTLKITKKIVNEAGEEVTDIDEDAKFKFSVKVDGYDEEQVIEVSAGQTWESKYNWNENESVPNYEITELDSEGYTFVSIERINDETVISDSKTITGSIIENNTVEIIAKNKSNKQFGDLQILKRTIDEDGNEYKVEEDTKFNFALKVFTDEKIIDEQEVTITINKGESSGTSEIFKYEIPEGKEVHYTIEELAVEDYKVLTEPIEGILNPGEVSQNPIEFINQKYSIKKFGSFKIIKNTVDKDGNEYKVEEDTNFKFKVIVYSDEITIDEIETTITLTKGESTGQSKVFTYEIPEGKTVKYTVEEIPTEGFERLTDKQEGILKAFEDDTDIEELVFKNKKEPEIKIGKLQVIKKTVKEVDGSYVEYPVEEDTTFDFTLAIMDETGKPKEQDFSLVVKAGQSQSEPELFEFEIEEGKSLFYRIYEKNKDGYSKISGKNEGEIVVGETPIEATVINEKITTTEPKELTGKLKIVKNLVDKDGKEYKAKEDTKIEFKLLVIHADETIEQEETITITIPKGKSSGESKTFDYTWKENDSLKYTITEQDKEGYDFVSLDSNGKDKVVDGKTVTGTLEADNLIIATAVNKKIEKTKVQKIKIVKKVVDSEGKECKLNVSKDFSFTLEVVDEDGNKKQENVIVTVAAGQSQGESTEFEFPCKEDQNLKYTVTENDLEEGFTFKEISSNGKDNTVEGKTAKGTLEDSKTVEVTAVNTKITKTKIAKLKITKQIVDSEGNALKVEKNTEFTFILEITDAKGNVSTENVKVVVPAGQSTATSQELEFKYKENEEAPSYKVKEAAIDGNFEFDGFIKNESGKLEENTVIEVVAQNKVKKLSSTLKIEKKLVNAEDSNDVTFKVKLYKNGIEYKTVEVSVNNPYTETIYWNATEETPTITVQEIEIPEGFELTSYVNNGTNLLENDLTIITVTNKKTEKIFNQGKIQISKQLLDGNEEVTGIPFKFKLVVSYEGKVIDEKTVTVNSGETWRSDFYYWENGKEAPTYTVEEIDLGDYELVSIEPKEGKLIADDIVSVKAINKLKKQNEGSLKIEKKVEIEDKVGEDYKVEGTFKFNVKIYYDDTNKYFEYNGEKYNNYTVTREVVGEGTTQNIDIKWYGDEAPKYIIDEISIPNEYRLREFEGGNSGSFSSGNTITAKSINEQVIERAYILTMELGGKVWDDTSYENGKPVDTESNGKIDENELGFKDIQVNIIKVYKNAAGAVVRTETPNKIVDASGNIITNGTLFTIEDGTWKIKEIAAPGVTAEQKAGGITASYDIEFVYDGQTYEPTKFLEYSNGDASKYLTATTSQRDNYLLDSMAIDSEAERLAFNGKFETIEGKEVMDSNGNTVGQTGEGEELNYTSKDAGGKLISTLKTTDASGRILEQFKMKARTSNGGLYYPFDSRTSFVRTDITIKDGVKHIDYKYHAGYPYLNSVNLGLVRRPEADAAVVKDLVEATVVIKGKALKYKFGELANRSFDKSEGLEMLRKQIDADKVVKEYTLNLYKSDYYYRASVYNLDGEFIEALNRKFETTTLTDTELEVYLKYDITLINESEEYAVRVNRISDYYDKNMTLVETAVNRNLEYLNGKKLTDDGSTVPTQVAEASIGWEQKGNVNSDFKKMTKDVNIEIASGNTEKVSVTYKVNKNYMDPMGLSDSLNIAAKKYNIAEIDSYSTFQDGKVAGKIDKDSAPGNLNINDYNDHSSTRLYEDDTEDAPALAIALKAETRSIDGTAWEDEETKEIDYKQTVGDGIRDTGEETIENMTTDLVEKVTVSGKDYEFEWKNSLTFGGINIKYLIGLEPETLTNAVGKYEFNGVVAGDYAVRFTYGDENTLSYNGQDYKSTAYQKGFKTTDADGYLLSVWHNLDNKGLAIALVSDARDDENTRLKLIEKSQNLTFDNTSKMYDVATLSLDNLKAKYPSDWEDILNKYSAMKAYTAKIDMNIETHENMDETNGAIIVRSDGTRSSFNYLVKDIDFGIEERSRTDINLDKQIEEIKLTTSSGDILIDAIYNIEYDTNGKLVKPLKLKSESIGTSNLQALDNDGVTQGFRYINIDEDILQGATIEVIYRITALNVGEVDRCDANLKAITDFTVAEQEAYENNSKGTFGKYLGKTYYLGENSTDAVVETTVHQVVDYVDNDVVFSSMENMNKNQSWVNTTTDQLTGLVDPDMLVDGIVQDSEGRGFETGSSNNLAISVDDSDDTREQLTNPKLVKALTPYEHTDGTDHNAYITLKTSRYYSTEIDSENIDNIAETIKVFNDVGRRAYSKVSGKATILGNVDPKKDFAAVVGEDDGSMTEVITLSPPTGIKTQLIFIVEVLAVTLTAGAILGGGIILIKKKVLTK